MVYGKKSTFKKFLSPEYFHKKLFKVFCFMLIHSLNKILLFPTNLPKKNIANEVYKKRPPKKLIQ
jgi:hypothetical protein